jgi:hypothetical protein
MDDCYERRLIFSASLRLDLMGISFLSHGSRSYGYECDAGHVGWGEMYVGEISRGMFVTYGVEVWTVRMR